MAQAHFYCLDYWVLDNATYRKSVELTFPAGFEADVSDLAAAQDVTAFSPVLWHTQFRSTDEYAVFLASVCPELPPSQSNIFAFCTRTYGGQNQFSNGNLPVGGVVLNALTAYLEYHFPTLATQVAGVNLLPSASRLTVVNAIAQLIQPGVPAVSWG